MTELPESGPGSMPSVPLNYAPATRVSGLAVASMVLGIVGIPMVFLYGVGFLMLIGGIALGLVAHAQIEKDPMRWAGKGFAIAGIMLGVVGSLFMACLLLPSLSLGSRELAPRSACAANLKGIATACIVYSTENNECFPTAGSPSAPGAYATAVGVGSGATTALGALSAIHSTAGAAGNPTSCLWLLVLQSAVSPRQLRCKEDPIIGWSGVAPLQNAAGQYYVTPQTARQISYSIAYPWSLSGGVAPWWRNLSDSSLPMMSDMAPFNGTGSPVRNVLATPATAGWPKVASSFNHFGVGQNVVYSDAHNEFQKTPLVDQMGGSIWTTGTGAVSSPAGSVGPIGPRGSGPRLDVPPFDTMMVPRRDGNTGELR